MLFELHLTVSPGTEIQSWSSWCDSVGAKPLEIHLAGDKAAHPVQKMFAATMSGTNEEADAWTKTLQDDAVFNGFKVIRSKLEVPLDKAAEYESPAYHEAHIKSLISPNLVSDVIKNAESHGWVSSTNILYPSVDGHEKWYFTKRAYGCSYLEAADAFREAFHNLPRGGFHAVRMESETVVDDTYEALDAGWSGS